VNEPPRRRRSDGDTEHNGGLPLFPLVLIVVFAGLLLGGILAHFFGGTGPASKAMATPVAVLTPTASPTSLLPSPPTRVVAVRPPVRPSPTIGSTVAPSPTIGSTVAPSPSPHATTTSARSPGPSPSTAPVSPSPKPTRAAPLPTPTHVATSAAKPVATASAKPVTKPASTTPGRVAAVTPAPNYVAPGSDQAAGIVRSYLGALARGDRATATTYLASGLPGEVFMDSSARIVSLHASPAGTQYRVTAEIATSTGAYYATFTLESGTGGLQIVDHYSIKTH
jgi:hypothetical protein